MTKREGDTYARDPHGWYVETRAAVEQLANAVDFGDDMIWDPTCGGGMIPGVMRARGHPVIGSDIIDRPKWRWGGSMPFAFYRANFLLSTKVPSPPPGRRLSIMFNPPYNEPERGIAQRMILHAIETVPFHRLAALVPIEFACGQGRYFDLYSRHRPSHVCFLMERPSMPPGEALLAHGEDARGGGMQDYVWIVWTAGGPWRTETLFLAPSSAPTPKSERRVRPGSQAAGVPRRPLEI